MLEFSCGHCGLSFPANEYNIATANEYGENIEELPEKLEDVVNFEFMACDFICPDCGFDTMIDSNEATKLARERAAQITKGMSEKDANYITRLVMMDLRSSL